MTEPIPVDGPAAAEQRYLRAEIGAVACVVLLPAIYSWLRPLFLSLDAAAGDRTGLMLAMPLFMFGAARMVVYSGPTLLCVYLMATSGLKWQEFGICRGKPSGWLWGMAAGVFGSLISMTVVFELQRRRAFALGLHPPPLPQSLTGQAWVSFALYHLSMALHQELISRGWLLTRLRQAIGNETRAVLGSIAWSVITLADGTPQGAVGGAITGLSLVAARRVSGSVWVCVLAQFLAMILYPMLTHPSHR